MDFSPYHKFQNSKTLERVLSDIETSKAAPDKILINYHQYHSALLHKLRCAMHYVTSYEDFTNFISTTRPEESISSQDEFLFEVNRRIDGFLYSAGSAMDILAYEVLTYFDGVPATGNVYFGRAHAELFQSHRGDRILPLLEDPRWLEEFKDYRNTSTHELILTRILAVTLDRTSMGGQKAEIVVPLPDNPRSRPDNRSFDNNPDALKYIEDTFEKLLDLVSRIYGHVARRTRNQGSLPLRLLR